ncbi:MAG TPA: hypothetical protein VG269_13945, partial [Tepidisphaeraceae bacterium]|nr:hypothetical protein [Tepidisphaeraceae bacterium]
MSFWLFHIFAYFAWAVLLFLVFLVLFEPGLRYAIRPRKVATDSDEFLQLLGALCDAQVHRRTCMEV